MLPGLSPNQLLPLRTITTLFWVAALAMLTGCAESEYPVAPVSGIVTLHGKPLEGARVTFQPRASQGSILAGKPSIGETDRDGHYQLKTYDGFDGAVIGTHRVSISTYRKKPAGGKSMDIVVLAEERVPAPYNRYSELTKEVPSSGLSDCDFHLENEY